MNRLPDRDHSIKGVFWETWLIKNVHVLVPDYAIGEYIADFAHLPTKTIFEFHRLAQEPLRDQVKLSGWQIVSIYQYDVERGVETIVQKILTLITNKNVSLQKNAVQVPSSLPTGEMRRSVLYIPHLLEGHILHLYNPFLFLSVVSVVKNVLLLPSTSFVTPVLHKSVTSKSRQMYLQKSGR